MQLSYVVEEPHEGSWRFRIVLGAETLAESKKVFPTEGDCVAAIELLRDLPLAPIHRRFRARPRR